MEVRLKKLGLSSQSLDKFILSQKNLSKTPPKLFPTLHKSKPSKKREQVVSILNVSHPVLQQLEQCCSTIRQFNRVHAQLMVHGLFQHPLAAGRCIKKLCTALNSVSYSVLVYDYVDERDAFMCNTIIRSFVNVNDPVAALRFYYERMVAKWVSPNHFTFPLVAKVSSQIGSLAEGQKAHAKVLKFGFESDLFVRNSFIHMYSQCGRVFDARVVFDVGTVLDLVSWNSMIDGYVKNGEVGLARQLFDEMCERDVFSWNSMISGYVDIGDMEAARRLFEKMPFSDIVSLNCMIDGYARIGNVSMARKFFDQMLFRNVVSWNIMFSLCLRRKDYGECLRLFDEMIEGGETKPNAASLVSVLTACANFRRLDKGKWIHSYIRDHGIEADVLLLTALLTMYAKCGIMDCARGIFDEMTNRSVVSCNSMIMGYGMHGQAEKAIEVFFDMEKKGPMPNEATFVCILSACAKAGMVLEGWWFFDIMHQKYRIEPRAEHIGCMIDLLGQAGLSRMLIKRMQIEAEATSRAALFSAFRMKISELRTSVAEELVKLYPDDIAPYLLLVNMYAAEGQWKSVDNVRSVMKEKGLESSFHYSFNHLSDFFSASCPMEFPLHRRHIIYSMLSEMGSHLKLSGEGSDVLLGIHGG
ncbi:hypothetical protein K2173_009517 [Erythroxylum novogranatense]|uniref:Uncharacterized protein n=1 Tax=Erythroxylum novogranatense TaxID=1862640 RepID=A0AAV8U465_9ROSI|nr:hypothetical protein K2173_009517 [Erythroxylum novogranatense]